MSGVICLSFMHNEIKWMYHLIYPFISQNHYTGADDHLRRNTFLTGNFAPVSKEHVSLPVEVVEGTIPSNLNGAFCRNGPNPIRDVQKKRYHWFDGREFLCVCSISVE